MLPPSLSLSLSLSFFKCTHLPVLKEAALEKGSEREREGAERAIERESESEREKERGQDHVTLISLTPGSDFAQFHAQLYFYSLSLASPLDPQPQTNKRIQKNKNYKGIKYV